MKTTSITFKLITFVTGIFLIALVAVMALVDSQLRAIVDKNQNVVYQEKLNNILYTFGDMDIRLNKTGLVDAYIKDFQSRAISNFRRTYYHDVEQDIAPFILDGDGKIIVQPSGPQESMYSSLPVAADYFTGKKSGDFVASHAGRETWFLFKRFEQWNWVIVYAVPLDVKYQDLLVFRKVFASVFLSIGVLAVLIMIWLLSRITKPIVELTNLTAQVAAGNLDQNIEVVTDDEVGTLARSFNGMRDAIKTRIDELNREIAERRKAEAASAVFQSAVATASDAVGMSTPDGVHFYQNKAFDAMFGEIGDDPPSTLYVDSEQGREVFQTIMSGGRWEGELQMYGADGEVLDILLRAYSIKNDDGQIVRLVGVHTDITEIKRAAAALEKRIVALTQPLDSKESIAFEDLFNIGDVQKLQDEFAEATGVASIITDIDGQPITEPSNFCRLCRDIIRKSPVGNEKCFQSYAQLGSPDSDGPRIDKCASCGLWDAGAPIAVGGKHIANWLIGQVRDESESPDVAVEFASEIKADAKEVEKAFSEVRVMSKERFEHVAQALATLANQFSNTAYQNVQQARFISERKSAEEELKRNEENLRTTLNSIGDAVISTGRDGLILNMNPVAETLTGWVFSDAAGKPLGDILKIVHSETNEVFDMPIANVLGTGEVATFDNPMILHSKNGGEFRVAITVAPIRDDSGTIRGAVMVFRDITAEVEMQEQLRHSQKMDAIGQLAGGVAHDFNNMLGGIMGSAELLKLKIADETTLPIVDMIIESADRAAGLTQKLLTFARKKPTMVQPVNVSHVIADAIAILKSSIDRRISVDLSETEKACFVNGDPGLLQSAILNLGINASHAMPDGGTVVITTTSRNLDEAYCSSSPFDIKPGDYVCIEVKDTGCGISSENLLRIYEPFFTTKAQGKGTGLGLAAVYGTVVQHKGAITVKSDVGVGTSFKVLLPILDDVVAPHETSEPPEAIRGSGKILVVDDERVMRSTVQDILVDLGYEVVTAEDGRHALEIFQKNSGDFDVVLLDMIMPKMNGRDCFVELKQLKPDVKVVLASGFANDKDLDAMNTLGLSGYIRKPFSRTELSKAVNNAIRK